MIKKKNIIFFSMTVLLMIIILINSSNVVLGRDNYAIGIGSVEGDIDTRQCVAEAITAYNRAGYRVYGVANPGKQHLWEQLYADVQFFNCHGSEEWVITANSGIIVGSDKKYGNKDCIGTDTVHWDADTILVIYASCEGAGSNGYNNANSVARKTAQRGADIVMAWRSKINSESTKLWTGYYNNALANGYTVIQAMDYANSFEYEDDRVPQNSTIIHHGDTSIKIGKYRSAGVEEVRPEDNLLLKSRMRLSNDTNNNSLEYIYSVIKENYPEFDEKNYIMSRGNAQSINENTGEIEETEYINLKLKIGEFETLSGFTIKIKNNIIEAIYDNTIDFSKEKNILKQKNVLQTNNFSKNNIETLKDRACNELLEAYNNNINVNQDEITYKYTYDINTNKKYINFIIKSTIGNIATNEIATAYDTIKYELN